MKSHLILRIPRWFMTTILVMGGLAATPSAHAQFTSDYQTNIINVASNWVSFGPFNGYFVGSNTTGNALIINPTGSLTNAYGYIGRDISASNNIAVVNGGIWTNRGGLRIGEFGAGNQLLVTNGGTVFSGTTILTDGAGLLGSQTSASNNMVVVTGIGSVWNLSGALSVGWEGSGNHLIVTDGGTVFNRGSVNYLGVLAASSSNVVTVSGNGALWVTAGSVLVGNNGSTNTLNIGTGGSVVSRRVILGTNAGADGNRINVTGGNLYVTNALGNGTLDIRRGTLTATAGGSITANNLHISPTGFVALTSSKINISGVVTNKGTFTMMHSVGTFNGAVVNSGAWIIDPTTNVFNSNFITTESGYVSAGAGDVFVFTNNATTAGQFLNRSTNSAAFNTADAKFLFNASLAVTQDFYAAGLNREALAPSVGVTDLVTGSWSAATFTNFSLGTLEISNFSTVRVWDAFSGLGGEFGANDGLKAALYVDNLLLGLNSYLIISDNVELYFRNSNSWSSANYSLLGSGELHQFYNTAVAVVPEPSVALLWAAGGATLFYRRRRCSRAAAKRGDGAVGPTAATSGVVAAVPAAVLPPIASGTDAATPVQRPRQHFRRRHRSRHTGGSWQTLRALGQKYLWFTPSSPDHDYAADGAKRQRRRRRKSYSK